MAGRQYTCCECHRNFWRSELRMAHRIFMLPAGPYVCHPCARKELAERRRTDPGPDPPPEALRTARSVLND